MKKIIFAIIVSLFLSSCGQKIEEKIIGKWKNDSLMVEFYTDKTYALKGVEGSVFGDWVILDDGRLKLTEISDQGEKKMFVSEVNFPDGDNLLVVGSGDNVKRYHRFE